jgi:hypothetical protein
MIIETNNHITTSIDKQILAFVAINTHSIVFPFIESNVVYSFVIGIFRYEKKINVFRVKDLKIYESGVQSLKEELALRCTF